MMKKLPLFIFSILIATISMAQTVEEVIGRFIDGNGGKEKLTSITSLQVESVLNLEQMGLTVNITNIKEHKKLFVFKAQAQ
jgi:hypothetical protein